MTRDAAESLATSPPPPAGANAGADVPGWVAELLPLVGRRASVLHAPRAGENGDVDCAVEGLDPMWPLRLGSRWRLCQCLHYDLRGWSWVIEKDGRALWLDLVEDPAGLGRDALPTGLFLGGGMAPPPAVRAAYLTAKRARKGILGGGPWAEISSLARDHPDLFRDTFARAAGPRLDALLTPYALAGTPPAPGVLRRARRMLRARRFRTPVRGVRGLLLGARREMGRIRRPTGLVVIVAGPDGAGKTTLADALPELCRGMFRRHVRMHWRPGVLPRPGAALGRDEPDPSRPHARRPHGRALSLVLLAYYWLDFLVGGWLRVSLPRRRSGLVIVERGWWDFAIDPRRYRLTVPPRLVGALGTLLPRPDLALVLDSPPAVLARRKAELSEGELARQATSWRGAHRAAARLVSLDASRPSADVARAARDQVLDVLESRAISRLGPGWAALPTRASARWVLPRGPRRAAVRSLSIYQPVTVKGRVGWEAARLLAAAGGFRLLRRGDGPPRSVREKLAPHLPPGSTMAVAKAGAHGRYVALVVGPRGDARVAKVATDPAEARVLEEEAEAIETLGGFLPPPLRPPRVIAREPGLLLLDAVPWRPRFRPWRLDEDVAWALGRFFRDGARDGRELLGPVHGDVAPWNLLQTADGWVLIDWEHASARGRPYFDLCHYLVRARDLLGRPSHRALEEGFRNGTGWVGRAIRAYAEGTGIPASEAAGYLRSCLTTAAERPGSSERAREVGA